MNSRKNILTEEEQRAVAEFTSRLRDRFPKEVDAIKLYGSKARGEARNTSDIDLLLIVLERTAALDDAVIDLVCDILNEFGVFLETVTLTSQGYRDAVAQQMPFALNVERDSVPL